MFLAFFYHLDHSANLPPSLLVKVPSTHALHVDRSIQAFFFFVLLIWLGAQLSQRALRHASIMRSFDDLVLLILLINLDRSLGERS